MIKQCTSVIKDYLNPYHLERFHSLLKGRVCVPQSSQGLRLGDHLLYFNPIKNELDRDGYFSYQTPSVLLDNPLLTYRRRLWAQGEITMYCAMNFNKIYICKEKIKFVKRIQNDYYVCIHRSMSDGFDTPVAKELRTLVYTNDMANDSRTNSSNNMIHMKGTLMGTFKFEEMDIINYGNLSLNSHRIHWDKSYCETKEGYKNIIVQGPLAVQVLMKFAHRYFDKPFSRVKYKNTNHIYSNTEVEIWHEHPLASNARSLRMWMKATDSEKVFLKAELKY
ncbi:hypothetical protein HG535_0C03160 [Zygotorulaspora mrakii]|uniref:MaoC-like domain-containing protein n=1 Tax=Zygotorulaspora mrakii TaxID=42260 RepID=A0A7H9B0D7_ZYGMR|nr:uncharacterized protein HG535_0C03160 [Zygotorulaspora mrakii]QLG71963.1 hypothetical protein HG535_0C03160 [Zygotorulaspora mrakii]